MNHHFSISAIDLNCDMGEGIGNDAAIMPYISSANIACGYHAGDLATMRQTVELALQHDVAIGAHPSFDDKKHFGRKEMYLPEQEIYEIVLKQILVLDEIVRFYGTTLHHVKPHGALYNMAAREAGIARAIARAVKDFDEKLYLVGLSGSIGIAEAKKAGLKTLSEMFADRTYGDDGSLTARHLPGALIEDEEKAVQQVLQMIHEGMATTISGKKIPLKAETVCIHGDGPHAAAFAKRISETLKKENIKIQFPP
jgi:UPF0271 protein